jgi:hypothetical protein
VEGVDFRAKLWCTTRVSKRRMNETNTARIPLTGSIRMTKSPTKERRTPIHSGTWSYAPLAFVLASASLRLSGRRYMI